MLLFAIIIACDRLGEVPECQKLLTAECEFRKVDGSTLEEIESDTKSICLSDCATQLRDKVGPCLQKWKPDVFKYCYAQWNTRCASISDILCYVERLDNWIAKGIHSVDEANKNFDKIPCSACQAQLVRNEKLFNQYSSGMGGITGQITGNVTQNCGANFLDGSADSNFQVFSPKTDSSTEYSVMTIVIAVLGTALFSLMIVFFVYYKWRKSRERKRERSSYSSAETYPRNEIDSSYDEYFSASPIRKSLGTVGDTAPGTRVQSGSDISAYMYSKPF